MKIGDTFLAELVAAGVSTEGIVWNVNTGEITGADSAQVAAAKAVLAAHEPTKALPPVYSGIDALDAMSEDALRKGRWKDALRIASADDVRTVKSKLKRIADANGMTVTELVPGIPVT